MLSPFATLAARRTSSAGVPTLVTVHSMWDRLGPLPALVRIVLRLRGWPIVWSAVSDAAAQPLREMLGPEIAVAVLPNAVDPALWQPRQRLADPTETAVVLISVMRLTRIKRTIPLARMLGSVRAAVPDDVALRAVIVGEGPRRMALERFLARHRMTDWVELPGRLDRGTVRERLATADCFVAPAEGESFGIAALEARAVGLPVIASRRSGVGEFVRDGREGLLAGDDASMVRAITRLITDRDLREQIRGHNERVPIDHDWTTALLRTQRLYHRAAQAAGTVTPAASGAGHAEHERRADRVVG
jgi:glycosyltransferase involved in cell wall biosynthesis